MATTSKARSYPRVLGITDEIETCEHCGKTGLKRTVELQMSEHADPMHYGVVCAARALGRSEGRVGQAKLERDAVTAARARAAAVDRSKHHQALRTELDAWSRAAERGSHDVDELAQAVHRRIQRIAEETGEPVAFVREVLQQTQYVARLGLPGDGTPLAPNAMDPKVAEAVMAAAPAAGKRLTSEQAKVIIRAWLRAKGYHEDRWGNFKVTDTVRYHFGAKVLKKQSKHEGGGGWFNLWSKSHIDGATSLLSEAGKLLGGAHAERTAEMKAARVEVKKGRREKAEEERIDRLADTYAAKELAFQHRADVVRQLMGTDEERRAIAQKLHPVLQELKAKWRERIRAGRGPEGDDGRYASVDRPPILPLYLEDPVYVWTEEADGVRYGVWIRHAGRGAMKLQVGSSGTAGFGVDPLSYRIEIPPTELAGDGFLTGSIKVDDDRKLTASLFMISVHERKTGAGTRLLSLWCRLMAGYGIEGFVAEAIGSEGLGFIEAMARKGRLQILRESPSRAYMLVRCAPAALPNAKGRRPPPTTKQFEFAGQTFESGPDGIRIHRETIDVTRKGDHGADPLPDGKFRMVPSGDIVDLEERNRRLARNTAGARPTRRQFAQWLVASLSDALGGDGWDDPRLVDITEGWFSDEDMEQGVSATVDDLLEASFDPRDCLPRSEYTPNPRYRIRSATIPGSGSPKSFVIEVYDPRPRQFPWRMVVEEGSFSSYKAAGARLQELMSKEPSEKNPTSLGAGFGHFSNSERWHGLQTSPDPFAGSMTPRAIYAYDLRRTKRYTYAADRKYVHLLEPAGKMLDATKYGRGELAADLRKLRELHGGAVIDQILAKHEKYKSEAPRQYTEVPAGVLYYVLGRLAPADPELGPGWNDWPGVRDPLLLTQRFRELGYCGFNDSYGIIYSSEPEQAAFFGDDCVVHVGVVESPLRASPNPPMRCIHCKLQAPWHTCPARKPRGPCEMRPEEKSDLEDDRLREEHPCPDCGGSGTRDDDEARSRGPHHARCEACDGSGIDPDHHESNPAPRPTAGGPFVPFTKRFNQWVHTTYRVGTPVQFKSEEGWGGKGWYVNVPDLGNLFPAGDVPVEMLDGLKGEVNAVLDPPDHEGAPLTVAGIPEIRVRVYDAPPGTVAKPQQAFLGREVYVDGDRARHLLKPLVDNWPASPAPRARHDLPAQQRRGYRPNVKVSVGVPDDPARYRRWVQTTFKAGTPVRFLDGGAEDYVFVPSLKPLDDRPANELAGLRGQVVEHALDPDSPSGPAVMVHVLAAPPATVKLEHERFLDTNVYVPYPWAWAVLEPLVDNWAAPSPPPQSRHRLPSSQRFGLLRPNPIEHGSGKYRVDYGVDVDHPELRDASFRRRAEPYRLAVVERFDTKKPAMMLAEAIRRGELDFASEYVYRVSVSLDTKGKTGTRYCRTVMADVRRRRGPDGKVVEMETEPNPRGKYTWAAGAPQPPATFVWEPPRHSTNPLLDLWRAAGGTRFMDDSLDMFETRLLPRPGAQRPSRFPLSEAGVSAFEVRDYATQNYAWGIPDEKAIHTIARYADLGRLTAKNEAYKILEVNAGKGYWAKLLMEAGAKVTATDPHPPRHTFVPIEYLTGVEAVEKYPDHQVLLTVWPPYQASAAGDALRLFRGRYVIFVGEGPGGCTANDFFFEQLDEDYEFEEEVELPRWPGLHDRLFVYNRRVGAKTMTPEAAADLLMRSVGDWESRKASVALKEARQYAEDSTDAAAEFWVHVSNILAVRAKSEPSEDA